MAGALQAGLLLAMVWQVWAYPTWVTNGSRVAGVKVTPATLTGFVVAAVAATDRLWFLIRPRLPRLTTYHRSCLPAW